jgi:hypothetical protein
MLNEQTIAIMNSLKLFGMARGFGDRLNDSVCGGLSHAEFVGLIVQDEKAYRDNKRLARLLKNARLRQPAALEDIDYSHARGLSRQTMVELSDTRWVAAHRNVLITGLTGVGKSFIACALGYAAARAGHTVTYTRSPRVFETLQQARGDGAHLRVLDKLNFLSWTTSCSHPFPTGNAGTWWRSSRGATISALPSSAASAQSLTGTRQSATRPWPMPSVTGCCTTPTG